MQNMLHKKWFQFLAGMLSAGIMFTAFYFIPPVHQRLSWRVDFAMTYIRSLVNPVQAVPTAAAQQPAATLAPINSTPTPTPAAVATAIPTITPTALPASASLPAPKYEKQTMNNCGPAALSHYLRFYGWDGNQETIASVLKPHKKDEISEDRNVNVEELVYYVRNYAGWLNIEYRVGMDLATVKAFLANGIPVMVEESFLNDQKYWLSDDLWAGHYQFINGYNDATRTIVVQDTFYGPDMAVSYTDFLNNWQSFNHVLIIIYLPEQEEVVKSILGENWDVDTNRQLALEKSILATNQPTANNYAWFNLGSNLVYFDRYAEAAQAFDRARELGLPQRMFRYQFSPFIAYFNALRNNDLMELVKYALQITPNSEEAHLWLGWAYYRDGAADKALSQFKKALYYNSNYSDAQFALDYLANN